MVDCGQPFTVDGGMSGNLTSPNYPDNYPNHAYCVWNISMPVGETIGIHLKEFSVEYHYSCFWDAVEVSNNVQVQ